MAVAKGRRPGRMTVGFGAANYAWKLGKRVGGIVKSYRRQRQASRMARSMGKRRMRPKLRGAVQKGVGGSITKHHMFIKSRKGLSRMLKKNLGKQIYTGNTGGQFNVGPGVQGASTLTTLFSGSFVYNGTGVSSEGQKVVLEAGRIELKLQNQASSNAQVELYEIVARRALPVGSSFINPDYAWSAGEALVSGGGSNSFHYLGSTPFDSKRFVDYFRVRKVFKFILGPGECHLHYSNFKMNYMLDSDVMSMSENIPGLTSFLMMVCSGMPAGDSSTSTAVTASNVCVDWVSSTRVVYREVQVNVPTVNVVNNLNTTYAVGEEDMEETGAKQGYTKA